MNDMTCYECGNAITEEDPNFSGSGPVCRQCWSERLQAAGRSDSRGERVLTLVAVVSGGLGLLFQYAPSLLLGLVPPNIASVVLFVTAVGALKSTRRWLP